MSKQQVKFYVAEKEMERLKLLSERRGNGYIAYDIGFNERLEQLAKRLLGEEK
ncbi:hypothetical protein [Bacillus thuringiensis]|uniref:hypothetical protein n=1 Tax=Bacillus thuringiensis TaxID=1428 RepID=UPI0015939F87|nr:hypothetical protein [Bacillus thuringiensis]